MSTAWPIYLEISCSVHRQKLISARQTSRSLEKILKRSFHAFKDFWSSIGCDTSPGPVVGWVLPIKLYESDIDWRNSWLRDWLPVIVLLHDLLFAVILIFKFTRYYKKNRIKWPTELYICITHIMEARGE